MTTLALIAVKLAQGVVALSAQERWQATQHLKNDNGILTNKWFTLSMVLALAVSATALFIVNLYKKARERKAAEKELSDNVARKHLTPPETDTLMAIAAKAGLKRRGDIFILSDAFDIGGGILLKESFSDGKPTNETGRLEKQLADLQIKLGFRKVSSAASSGGGLVGSAEKPGGARSADSASGETAFIAIFPFAKIINGDGRKRPQQGDSPPGLRQLLPEFIPATVTGLVGRVLFIETTLPAHVGDRIMVVIGPKGISEKDPTSELIEDIGIVVQTIQPAELLKTLNARRLGVELAGLNDTQIVQLAEAIGDVKAQGMMEQVMPAGSKEGSE